MTEKIHCDQCDKVLDREWSLDCIKITLNPISAFSPNVMDFCCWSCLAEYSKKRVSNNSGDQK